ncbi:hypothetical protein ANCCAN_22680 [Ancylostoma caninum]|uniref:Uncharacterized protein n=1 Tax=Ancylostoma caninum TaxID=29170 RepID=A0A368FH98_ANCCA|nr:hypothetical protein ANCCAN_22680 [Ancylostoma caninum]
MPFRSGDCQGGDLPLDVMISSENSSFVHSFARRDYIMKELALDRHLRKKAGDMDVQAGKMLCALRDLDDVR